MECLALSGRRTGKSCGDHVYVLRPERLPDTAVVAFEKEVAMEVSDAGKEGRRPDARWGPLVDNGVETAAVIDFKGDGTCAFGVGEQLVLTCEAFDPSEEASEPVEIAKRFLSKRGAPGQFRRGTYQSFLSSVTVKAGRNLESVVGSVGRLV